jgi:hypothetical protein
VEEQGYGQRRKMEGRERMKEERGCVCAVAGRH